MTTTKQYDNLDRLTSISSLNPQLSTLSSFSYGYNSANQRITRTDGDNTHWNFGYDFLGQVTNGTKYWADNTPVPGEQFQYTFDNIGNRTNTLSGGDQFGGSLLLATYTANDLNQYSSRTVPSGVEILGIANVQASVTVNGISNAYRRGEFFQKTLTATNTNSPVWLTATSTSTLGTASSSVTGSLFVPQSPENYTYDADGNLLSDGRFSYTWDAENRLIRVVSATSAGPQQAIWFDYDYQGRRIRKRLWNSTTATNTTPAGELHFVYDGWNLIAVLDGNNSLLESFAWGADLSCTVHEAGGVGGLVSMTIPSGQPNAGTYYPCFDGNGNVMALVNAANGTSVAQYEYDAFGNLVQATGPMATANNILFSSKYFDWETGLYYYGYRYYNPNTGRWLSRDPIGEAGGLNLYGFVGNSPVGNFDRFGLASDSTSVWVQFVDTLVTGDTWWQQLAYTGQLNPTEDVLDQATTEAGAYAYYYGALRGFFAGAGSAGKLSGGTYMPGYFGGGELRWTIEGGYGGQIQLGGGLQMRGRTTVLGYGTKPFVSSQCGLSGTYTWDQQSGGFANGSFGMQLYGGQANRLGGYGFTADTQTFELGITYGNFGLGIIVDPQRLHNLFNSDLPIPDDSYSPPLPVLWSSYLGSGPWGANTLPLPLFQGTF